MRFSCTSRQKSLQIFFGLFIKGIFVVFLSSCHHTHPPQITYQLSRTDYVEKIHTTGTVQATRTVTIYSPRIDYNNMIVTYIIDEGSMVKAGDTICILETSDIIQRYEDLESTAERIKMDINKLIIENEIKLSALESQIKDMEIKIALNSLDSIQKQYAPLSRQTLFTLELEKAKIEETKLRKKYVAQKKIYQADLRRLNSRLTNTGNQINSVLNQISSLTIKASKDGMILHTEAPNMRFMSSRGSLSMGGRIELNSTVFANMAVLQMPDLNEMQVMLEVQESDYKRILPGQKVEIYVDALEKMKTTGEVKKKTLARRSPHHQSAIKLYELIVSVDSCHSKLKPGLSASCEITVNEVKDTVVVPTLAIFERDSLKIVYVSNGEKFRPTQVEVGLTNSSSSIISKGLSGNELIALSEPPPGLIDRKKSNPAPLVEKQDTVNTAFLQKNNISND